MTQIIINESDFPKKTPDKMEDFIAGPEDTAVFFRIAGNMLPIKREFADLFADFKKKNKKTVMDYCGKIFKEV